MVVVVVVRLVAMRPFCFGVEDEVEVGCTCVLSCEDGLLKCISRDDWIGLTGQPVSLYLGLVLAKDKFDVYSLPLRGRCLLLHCCLTSCQPASGRGSWYVMPALYWLP